MFDESKESREEKTLVYVAGPYTEGTPDVNVRRAVDAAEKLRQAGLVPFVPHLNFLWGMVHQNSYDYWMEWCLDWLARCDAIVRLPGQSKGGDIEVEQSEEWDLAVYDSVEGAIDAEV